MGVYLDADFLSTNKILGGFLVYVVLLQLLLCCVFFYFSYVIVVADMPLVFMPVYQGVVARQKTGKIHDWPL